MPRSKRGHRDEYPPGDTRDVLKWPRGDTTFHIGQSYEKEAATTAQCAICGSKEFNVGCGDYYTAIRCPTCGWERLIHEG